MKTYVHKKSGVRYPDHGCGCWFTSFSSDKGRLKHHIKPGYPHCTNGWKAVKLKDWSEEEIPDLTKPFTDAQWKAYADKYGVIVAQEFFDCCDYSKPIAARQILTPATGDWPEEIRAWFKATFRQPVDRFICGMSWAYANHYSIDILKFERYLGSEFGYPYRQDGSMRDFMIKTFGQAATDKFQAMLKPH